MKKLIRISSICFVMFYIISALYYPSFFNPIKLFFCDLMQINVGGPSNLSPGILFAILALLSISIVITAFFIGFSNQANWSVNKKRFTKISGGISAFFTALIFTSLHDEFILIASIIGILPLTFVAIEIFKNRSDKAPILGLISLLFLTFYNLTFYLNIFDFFWPIMQKTSIILCLTWINFLTFKKSSFNLP